MQGSTSGFRDRSLSPWAAGVLGHHEWAMLFRVTHCESSDLLCTAHALDAEASVGGPKAPFPLGQSSGTLRDPVSFASIQSSLPTASHHFEPLFLI